jgi:hypothetical protein
VPWLIGINGLLLFGPGLQQHLHWIVIAFGWGLNSFSTLGSTTAISAYFLDVIPQHAALTSAWSNAFRTIGGCTVVWFDDQWVQRNGPAIVFSSQAAIVSFFIISIILTRSKGASWRQISPPPVTSRTV